MNVTLYIRPLTLESQCETERERFSSPTDAALERAVQKCVLKPLRGSLDSALHEFQVNSGVWQRLQENMALAKGKQPRELGVDGAKPPDPHTIERIRHKLRSMCKMYSPERKVMVLLRVCKLIYTVMQDHSGEQGNVCITKYEFFFQRILKYLFQVVLANLSYLFA